MRQKVLIVGYNGLNNVGADLRSVVVARMLSNALDLSDIALCTFDASNSAHLLPGAKQVVLRDAFLSDLTSAVQASDAIVISEGCAFFPETFALYAHALRLAADMQKRAVVFGCSVGALIEDQYTILKEVCRETLIFARDKLGSERLRARGISVRPGTDPIWALGDSDVVWSSLGAYVGSPRDLIVVCPGSRFSDDASYGDALVRALRPIQDVKTIVLASLDPVDERICTRVADRLGVSYLDGRKGFTELFNVLGRAHAVVSARYHGIVLGILLGAIPLFLARDRRLLEFGSALPWPNLVVDCRRFLQSDRLERALSDALTKFGCGDVGKIVAPFRASALNMGDEALGFLFGDKINFEVSRGPPRHS